MTKEAAWGCSVFVQLDISEDERHSNSRLRVGESCAKPGGVQKIREEGYHARARTRLDYRKRSQTVNRVLRNVNFLIVFMVPIDKTSAQPAKETSV